jgi:chromosome segregation ATPase
MSPDAPQAQKPPQDASEATSTGGTDEDILRLRSRLERELAMVTQKLVDAEESIIDMEIAVRAYETGSRPRLANAAASGEKGTEKITARLKAVGDGINKIAGWITKRDGKDGESEAAVPSLEKLTKTSGDLEDRLDEAMSSISLEIRECERNSADLDRRLHEAQKELIRFRAQEQHVREMQLRMGETKQMSEELERRMALLDGMVRTFESSMKSDTGMRTKSKEPTPALPKFEDRFQTAIGDALKGVAAQEKKVAEIEKELEKANHLLVEGRTRQQRIRSMQMRLRQARHFSTDLQRALSGMASSIEDLRMRAGGLLKPESRTAREASRTIPKPAEPAAKPAPRT